MLKLETRTDLVALEGNRVIESSNLEYKASSAVENTEGKKTEISKDVSAMANAGGGQIVYGMTEKDHLPAGLDEGLDPKRFNSLWFEQVIQQNIRQPIEGLVITPIALDNGNNAFVLTIPAAQARAPHQARDGRYYRRRNFRNDIMEDYEVREAMQRTTTPKLFVQAEFLDTGSPTAARLQAHEDGIYSKPITVGFVVTNEANRPAEYAVLVVLLDTHLVVLDLDRSNFVWLGHEADLARQTYLQKLSTNLGLPRSPPLFRESPHRVGELSFQISHFQPGQLRFFSLVCDIRTSGYALRRAWKISQLAHSLVLEHVKDELLTK